MSFSIDRTKDERRNGISVLAKFRNEEKSASRKLSTISRKWAISKERGYSKEKILKELLKGYGSVLDISGGRQITFNPRRLSDADILGGDWKRVGDDMRIAFVEYKPQKVYGKRKQAKTRTARPKGFSIF